MPDPVDLDLPTNLYQSNISTYNSKSRSVISFHYIHRSLIGQSLKIPFNYVKNRQGRLTKRTFFLMESSNRPAFLLVGLELPKQINTHQQVVRQVSSHRCLSVISVWGFLM